MNIDTNNHNTLTITSTTSCLPSVVITEHVLKVMGATVKGQRNGRGISINGSLSSNI